MPLPEEIEVYRDTTWRRDPDRQIESVYEAERFVDEVGFCASLTDSRRPGPSLFVAVCGRRDAHMPRNVQKDPESNLAWTLKDQVMQRGKCFYAKILRTHATFISSELLPAFVSLLGVPRKNETEVLDKDCQAILKVLRREWEMGTKDLRVASGVLERVRFDRAMVRLQKAFKLMPVEVLYKPTFTYIWSIPEARFKLQFDKVKSITREDALKEIARAYLNGAGMTMRGELARFTGLGSPDAGLGNWGLVDEGYAERLGPGVYRLKKLATANSLAQIAGHM